MFSDVIETFVSLDLIKDYSRPTFLPGGSASWLDSARLVSDIETRSVTSASILLVRLG